MKLLNAIGRRVTPSDAALGALDSVGEENMGGAAPEWVEGGTPQSCHSPVSSSTAPLVSSSSSACNSQQEQDAS